MDSRAVSILCIACGNTDLPSLVPIKIWKLSEYPRVVPGPNGQAIEVSQPIVPPIYRDLDDDDDSEDEADCSLGDVHTNWDQYLAALHQFNSRVLMYYQAQAAGRKSTLGVLLEDSCGARAGETLSCRRYRHPIDLLEDY